MAERRRCFMSQNLVRVLIALSLASGLTAEAADRLERVASFTPGSSLVLNVEGGAVTVTGGSGSTARLVVTSRKYDLDEVLDLTVTEGPDTLTIRGKNKKKNSWLSGGYSTDLHYELELPSRA